MEFSIFFLASFRALMEAGLQDEIAGRITEVPYRGA